MVLLEILDGEIKSNLQILRATCIARHFDLLANVFLPGIEPVHLHLYSSEQQECTSHAVSNSTDLLTSQNLVFWISKMLCS